MSFATPEEWQGWQADRGLEIVPPEKLAAGHKAVEDFGALLLDLINHRRKNPDDGTRGEVLAALIFGEEDGEKDGDDEDAVLDAAGCSLALTHAESQSASRILGPL